MRAGVVLLCLAFALPALAEPALGEEKLAAKQAKPAKAAAKAKDAKARKAEPAPQPVSNAITESYNALTLAERIAIQADLILTGDYGDSLNGEFGPAAVAAVKAFQKRKGNKETGVLNPQERGELSAAARPRKAARGWRIVDDAATGTRLLVPASMMPQASAISSGSRWASARGEMAIETFRAPPGNTLAAVFEQMKKSPADRRIASSSMQGDSFRLGGLQNLKLFQARGYARGDEVHVITVLYDQALDGIMVPVATAVMNAFAPFPTGVATPPPKSKVEYASGIVVSNDGHIITDRDTLDGCPIVTIAEIGGVDRIAEDKGAGLALLRIYGVSRLNAVMLASEAGKSSDITLVGVADPRSQDGGRSVSVARARLSELRTIDPMPGPGFTGAAALDAQGRLAGMVALKPTVFAGASNAGMSAMLTPVEAIRNFLDANNVPPAVRTVVGDAAKGAVVRVICVRR